MRTGPSPQPMATANPRAVSTATASTASPMRRATPPATAAPSKSSYDRDAANVALRGIFHTGPVKHRFAVGGNYMGEDQGAQPNLPGVGSDQFQYLCAGLASGAAGAGVWKHQPAKPVPHPRRLRDRYAVGSRRAPEFYGRRPAHPGRSAEFRYRDRRQELGFVNGGDNAGVRRPGEGHAVALALWKLYRGARARRQLRRRRR